MLGLTGLNLALSYSLLPESLWYFSYETSLKLMCYNYDNFLLVWYHQSAADMPLTFCATLSGWWMNSKVFTQLHSLMKSTFLLRKDLWWLWNKQNNAHTPPPMWLMVDVESILLCSTCEISCWTLKGKFHMYTFPCAIPYLAHMLFYFRLYLRQR